MTARPRVRRSLIKTACGVAAAAGMPLHAAVFDWSGGDYIGAGLPNPLGSGNVVNVVAGNSKTFSGSIVNNGRFNWFSNDTLAFTGSGSRLQNNGIFDFQADGWVRAFAGGIVLDNAGTLAKSGGSGNLLIDATYINRSGATLSAGSGAIRYQVGGTIEAGSIFTGAGSHVFETTDTVAFSNHFTAATNNVRFNRGTFSSTGSDRMVPRTNLGWSGGVLQGSWGNGAGRTMTALDGFDKAIVGSFVNDGRLNWATTNQVSLNGTGTALRNNGTLDFQADGWVRAFASGIVLDNAGTLRKSAGTSNLLIDSALSNTGVIESLSGNIVVPNNWRNDGTLRGTAGFQTNVLTNAGDVAPGVPGTASSLATLTLTGSLIETAAGSLSFDVASGGVSDLLNVSGSVVFGGKLRVGRLGDYTAREGDIFRVMNFASFSGSLLDIEESGFGGGVEFAAIYSPTHLDIRVGAVPEPAGYALMAGGLLGLWLWLRRRLHTASSSPRSRRRPPPPLACRRQLQNVAVGQLGAADANGQHLAWQQRAVEPPAVADSPQRVQVADFDAECRISRGIEQDARLVTGMQDTSKSRRPCSSRCVRAIRTPAATVAPSAGAGRPAGA